MSQKSIAVLYFENMSSDPESDYFCAGITEDLLTDLSKVKGLVVASRNAVVRYRGRSVDMPQVAKDLGVATVLEGSVRKVGDRVRINAQLIEASTGFHLWAERYDRTLDDIFAVQDDITSAIATALRGTLSSAEAAERQSRRPNDVRAYDLWLKGQALYHRYEEPYMFEAIECFEQAIAIEPTYALAWADVANACAQIHKRAWDLDPEWLDRGRKAGQRALELAPSSPEVLKAVALLACVNDDMPGSEEPLLRALDVDPLFHIAHVNLGDTRIHMGDLASGERSLRRSIELDSAEAYAMGLLLSLLVLTRRYSEAVELSFGVQSIGSGTFYQLQALTGRATALALQGDFDEAHHELGAAASSGLPGAAEQAGHSFVDALAGKRPSTKAAEDRSPGFSHALRFHAWAAAAAGDAVEAVRVLRLIEQIDPHTWSTRRHLVRSDIVYGKVVDTPEISDWLGEHGRRIVWPSEAPPLTEAERARFAEYSDETGLPGESSIP